MERSATFLYAAYYIVWAGLAVYLIALLLKLRKVEDRLRRIERKVLPEGQAGPDA